MKNTVLTLTGGASYTNIVATVPAHLVRVTEIGATPVGLSAKFPDDAYANAVAYDEGAEIKKGGHGYHGILAKPPHYNSADTPATGELYMKLKACNDSAVVQVLLEEYEYGERP